jgi:hypothetical protein
MSAGTLCGGGVASETPRRALPPPPRVAHCSGPKIRVPKTAMPKIGVLCGPLFVLSARRVARPHSSNGRGAEGERRKHRLTGQ